MSPDRIEELLLSISSDLAEIKQRLNADFRAIHGNGHKGLLERTTDLEVRLARMEAQGSGKRSTWQTIASVVSHLVALLMAGLAITRK